MIPKVIPLFFTMISNVYHNIASLINKVYIVPMELTSERERLIMRCLGIAAKIKDADPLGTDQAMAKIKLSAERWIKSLENHPSNETLLEIKKKLNETTAGVTAFYNMKWMQRCQLSKKF